MDNTPLTNARPADTGEALDLFAPVALPDPPAAACPPSPAPVGDTKLICVTTAYGDTLWGLGRLFGMEAGDIAAMNGIEDPDRIFPGRRLYLRVPASIPIAACDSYTVRRGDTLSGIAQRLGLDANALAQNNLLFDPDVIYEGQVLRI